MHHFVYYPIVLSGVVLCGYQAYTHSENRVMWIAFGVTFYLLTWLSYMMRQHYALTLQDRTVRLELRLRYYILTQKRFEEWEKRLSPGQIKALRFAPDDEFLNLLQRAADEKLSPGQIKRAIRHWDGDYMRV